MGRKLPEDFDPSRMPTSTEMETALSIPVFDGEGKSHVLKDLLQPGGMGKSVGVWIRHFHCGMCMEYVTGLMKAFKEESLAAANVNIVLIGCGDWVLVKPYAELLQCPFPIYADPSKKSYEALGMTLRTLDMGKGCGKSGCGDHSGNGGYVEKGLFGIITKSIGAAFKMKHFTASAGDSKQVGGEFVFSDGECIFASRMRTTRDHAPIPRLASAAGIAMPNNSAAIKESADIPQVQVGQPESSAPVVAAAA